MELLGWLKAAFFIVTQPAAPNSTRKSKSINSTRKYKAETPPPGRPEEEEEKPEPAIISAAISFDLLPKTDNLVCRRRRRRGHRRRQGGEGARRSRQLHESKSANHFAKKVKQVQDMELLDWLNAASFLVTQPGATRPTTGSSLVRSGSPPRIQVRYHFITQPDF